MRRNRPHFNKRYPWLNDLDVNLSVRNKISRLLDRIVSGDSKIIAHPIISRFGDLAIAGWDKIFESRKNELLDDFVQLEEKNRSKIGPRSIAVPWSERKIDVDSQFGANTPTRLSACDLERVCPSTFRNRPLSLDKAISYLKTNTNSGLPEFTKKSRVIPNLLANYKYLLDRCDPCILFTRTQESKKTRTVWGYPSIDTLAEMCFFRVYFDYERKLAFRSALLSTDEVDNSLDKLITESIRLSNNIISVDFPLYDASVKRDLQSASFRYISGLFQKSYHGELSRIAKRFLTIGLITPDGVRTGEHGVPSGSTFTNAVDSCVQHMISKHFGISDDMKQIQGDDGVYSLKNPDDLVNHFADFGLNINRDKTFTSTDSAIFLQNFYSDKMRVNGRIRGIYPSYRALGRIFYQERFTDLSGVGLSGTDFHSIRTISILENCKFHPLFVDLVKYISRLDKASLEYSQTGLEAYVSHLASSNGTEGLFFYRRGDDLSGIKSFSTVKVLESLNSGNTS